MAGYKALFLDRDGVVNIEKDYLYKIEDFEFIDGILEVCKHFLTLGYKIIVITNQSGIARGYYTNEEYEKLTAWMVNEFNKHNIEITKVYHCPHHPELNGECECRKPKSGLFLKAKDEFNIDMQNSIVIGDNKRDIEAAINVGIKEAYLLSSTQKHKNAKNITHLKEIIDAYTK